MITRDAAAGMVLMGALMASLLSCATVREKTEAYILAEDRRLTQPVDAWLRTVEIVSNGLPLSDDYALIRDSLTAIASRHGLRLSTTRGSQPYVVDLVIHERSYAVDLEPSSSLMAVLNVSASSDDEGNVARVVHSAIATGSEVSLYQVTQIAEKIFGSLSKALADEDAKASAKARTDSGAAPAPSGF
jgi:hypothetical protein